MKVYIAMPISAASGYDPQQMFRTVAAAVRSFGLEPVLPGDDVDPAVWESWLNERPFRECCEKLVQSDLANLESAEAIMAFMPNASIGVAMEIAYARLRNKRVVVVTSLETFYHPWLWAHADRVIWSDDPFREGVRRACELLLELSARG